MNSRIVLFAIIAVLLPVFAFAQPSPYSGQQGRDVKSLSPDEVRGYLAGEGLGFAKAGELNHYPGPKHVLAMSEHLALTAAQRRRIETIAASMTSSAVPLGREIIAAERALDRGFADATIDDATLRAQTARIGALQGRLRAVHLSAHLATRRVLTAQQVAAYDRMRGYGGGMEHMHHHE